MAEPMEERNKHSINTQTKPLFDDDFLEQIRRQMLKFATLQLSDAHLAEDVVQDVFVELWHRKKTKITDEQRRCVKMHPFFLLRTKPRLSQAGALLLPKDFVSLGIRISL